MKICMLFVPRFFQDIGCVHASMEWTPLQTGGESLGMDAPHSPRNTEARFLRL